MKITNKIFNYYVSTIPGQRTPVIYSSPITINPKTAKELINKQLIGQKKPIIRENVLHVCYDFDSQRIYVPNANEFSKDKADYLIQAAQVRVTKDFGGYSSKPPIKGSPFSSLRVRSINSFIHAKAIISKHYGGKIFKDLPVIEANLARMPSTTKKLPQIFSNPDFVGGYVGGENPISFIEEIDINGKKNSEPISLLVQQPPFILINVSPTETRGETSATEKENAVLSGYRDYLNDANFVKEEKYILDDISQFADLYSIKRNLYLGWSFEEVSSVLLRDAKALPDLLNAINRLMMACDSLQKEGHKNPASIPYYITFKIDPANPPVDLNAITDKQTGRIKTEIQYKNFLIIDFDSSNDYILIETPAFISPDICKKLLKAKSEPFICRYNSAVNKIDIKSTDKSYSEVKYNKIQLAKVKAIVKSDIPEDKKKDLDYRHGLLASGASAIDPRIYSVKKVSDYLYATEFIKKMCDKYKIPFYDLDVITGPIEQAFGAGVRGGFMDANAFKMSKIKVPFEIAKGVFLTPPVILINSVRSPSPAEQTEIIVHEYRHYIYMTQNVKYKMEYGEQKRIGDKPDYEYWYRYLNDPNEREAHKEQIKFELGLGKSYDEIIRNKVEGKITLDNYPIAIKFAEMVREALTEMEEEGEKNEEPTRGRESDGLPTKPTPETSK